MIIERVTFNLKFGKAKEAKEIWKQILDTSKQRNNFPSMRVLTDLTGPSYVLVLEMKLRSLQDIGQKNYEWMTNKEMAELYQKFIPLCDSASREYYTIEAEI